MIAVRNFKYKLYLTPSQEKTLFRWQGLCKYVWNIALEQRERAWNMAKTHGPEAYKAIHVLPSEYGQSAQLTQIKKEFLELREVPSGTLTNVLTMVDASYKQFWRNLKTSPERAGKPRFKGCKDSIGLKFKNRAKHVVALKGGYARINLDKLGSVRFRMVKPHEGVVKNCLVVKEKDAWYICLVTDIEVSKKVNSSTEVAGADWGVKNFISLSTGETLDLEVDKNEEKIKFLQRRLKNKTRGSKQGKKLYEKIAKLLEKNKRSRDYQIKLMADTQTKRFGMLAFEKLNVKGMTKSAKGTLESPGKNVATKSRLNKAILAKAPGLTLKTFEYFGEKNGCLVETVPAKNTSLRCSSCGIVDKQNRLSQESFVCVSCGFELNADLNAAINIRHAALAAKLSVKGKEPLEESTLVGPVKEECTEKSDGFLSI